MMKKHGIVLRATLVVAMVSALVVGVTFAALSDDAGLTGNTLASETADLQVSSGGAYSDSATGFAATDLIPGDGQTFAFYLSNGSDFDMNVTASVDGVCSDYIDEVTIPNCGDVLVSFTDKNSATTLDYTLQQLINNPQDLPGNALEANEAGSVPSDVEEGDFEVTFDLDADDVTGDSVSVSAFDITFNGTQVTP